MACDLGTCQEGQEANCTDSKLCFARMGSGHFMCDTHLLTFSMGWLSAFARQEGHSTNKAVTAPVLTLGVLKE